MRLLFIAAACALVAAGSASAQTRGLAPTTSPLGAPATVTTGHTATMPGPAAKPSTMGGATMARPTTMAQPMAAKPMPMHTGARHMRRHRRTHSAAWCMRRANARHLSSAATTRYVQRCQAGRRHHRRHGMAHHAMAHPMTTTTTTTMAKPMTTAKPMTAAPRK